MQRVAHAGGPRERRVDHERRCLVAWRSAARRAQPARQRRRSCATSASGACARRVPPPRSSACRAGPSSFSATRTAASPHADATTARRPLPLAVHGARRRYPTPSRRSRAIPTPAQSLERDFAAVLERVQPTLVLVPSPRDSHPDHAAAGLLALRLLARRGGTRRGALLDRAWGRGLAGPARDSRRDCRSRARRSSAMTPVPRLRAHARRGGRQARRAQRLPDADADARSPSCCRSCARRSFSRRRRPANLQRGRPP